MEFAKIQKFDNFGKTAGKLEGNRPSDIFLMIMQNNRTIKRN